MTTEACKAGCGAEIAYYRNDKTGKVAPVNLAVDPTGNVTLDFGEGTYHVLTKQERAALDNPGMFAGPPTARFTLHFATCPNADKFRRCGKCHRTPCVCKGQR